MIGIYKIANKNNGKVYIGQSDNIERRLSEHKRKRTETIDDYINILGIKNFDFEVVEECSKEELDKKEQEYIKYYNSAEDGYNYQLGGFNNSSGESNGRALLTETDVRFIRQCYAEHRIPKDVYNEYYKDLITQSQFQTVWQGRSWSAVMPEVFTEENKRFYSSEMMKTKALLTKSEIFHYRKYYVDHTRDEVYQLLISEKGPIYKERTFQKILMGDTRDSSIYKDVPIYKKSKKLWVLNGKPLSTIPETWE